MNLSAFITCSFLLLSAYNFAQTGVNYPPDKYTELNLKGPVKQVGSYKFYDKAKKLTYVAGEKTFQPAYVFDKKAQLVGETKYRSAGETMEPEETKTYTLYENGQIKTEITTGKNNELGMLWYSYHANGKIKERKDFWHDTINPRSFEEYDINGTRKKRTVYKGEITEEHVFVKGVCQEHTTISKDTLATMKENQFDSEGRCTEQYVYNPDNGILLRMYTSKYNAAGLLEEEVWHDYTDPQPLMRKTWQYDDQKRVIKTERYEPLDRLHTRKVKTYNAAGQVTDDFTTGIKDKFISRTSYEYDEKGNLVKKTEYKNATKPGDVYTSTYEFDEKGNWIKRLETTPDGPYTTVRTLVYY